MFGGHAPPFGWYCSASKSRSSEPRSTAICVTSPVAPGWFVDSSPRSWATRKHRPPAARTTVVASIVWSPQRGPVAAVLPSELDAELLEPVDRRRGLRGEDLDELAVGGLVRGLPDVL